MEGKQHFADIDAMREGVDYVGLIKVRGFETRVRPLSSYEQMQIFTEVAEDFSVMPEKQRTNAMESFLLAKKTLMKATTSDVGENDSRLNEQILNRMTMNEIISLHKEYCAMEDRVNPILEEMTNEQLQALVDYLKKTEYRN